MDPVRRVIEAARAVIDAYRLAEMLSDGWEDALRAAVDRLAAAMSELPQEFHR